MKTAVSQAQETQESPERVLITESKGNMRDLKELNASFELQVTLKGGSEFKDGNRRTETATNARGQKRFFKLRQE